MSFLARKSWQTSHEAWKHWFFFERRDYHITWAIIAPNNTKTLATQSNISEKNINKPQQQQQNIYDFTAIQTKPTQQKSIHPQK